MQYYYREMKLNELLRKFNISQTTYCIWRDELGLPIRGKIEIPQNFKELYMKFYNGELSQYEFTQKCHASVTVICRWRDKFNLPLATGAQKTLLGRYTPKVSSQVEPSISQVASVDDHVRL